jgi:hypothetical protein
MKKYIPFLLLILLMIPLMAFAQATQVEATLCTILQIAKNIVAAIGLGIAIILLIVSGIKYMTSGGDAEKANDAKRGIINAIIGIVIVVGALFLLALAQTLVTDVGGAGVNVLGNPCTGYVVP